MVLKTKLYRRLKHIHLTLLTDAKLFTKQPIMGLIDVINRVRQESRVHSPQRGILIHIRLQLLKDNTYLTTQNVTAILSSAIKCNRKEKHWFRQEEEKTRRKKTEQKYVGIR